MALTSRHPLSLKWPSIDNQTQNYAEQVTLKDRYGDDAQRSQDCEDDQELRFHLDLDFVCGSYSGPSIPTLIGSNTAYNSLFFTGLRTHRWHYPDGLLN